MKFNNIDLEITNKLDWEHVSRYCELSEEFIEMGVKPLRL